MNALSELLSTQSPSPYLFITQRLETFLDFWWRERENMLCIFCCCVLYSYTACNVVQCWLILIKLYSIGRKNSWGDLITGDTTYCNWVMILILSYVSLISVENKKNISKLLFVLLIPREIYFGFSLFGEVEGFLTALARLEGVPPFFAGTF